MTLDKLRAYSRIADRVLDELAPLFNVPKVDLMMDLEFTDEDCPLDLDALENFERFDFAHDIYGMRRHLNRETKRLENCFVPRCAKPA